MAVRFQPRFDPMDGPEHTPPERQSEDPTAWFDRYFAIPGLLFTSLVCYALLGLQLSGFRGSEGLLAWTTNNGSAITIGVQVLSHILGLVHVQVICALIRTSFMLLVTSKPFPIYLAQFVQAASTPRMTWALPWRFSMLLFLIVSASFVPAAMWAGAISPSLADKETTQSMSIPTFEVASVSALWGGNDANSGPTLMTNKGLFSFDPASVKGAIVQSAADASTSIQGIKKHAKLDKSGYMYLDRSHATGSIAGLGTLSGVTSPNWYSYAEDGFTSNVSCFYNDTMIAEYGWQLYEYSWGLLANTAGSLVTGKVARIINYYGYTTSDFLAWGTDYDNATKTIAVQLISTANETNDGWGFQKFNGVQCNIEYKPDTFDVLVNITGKTITSTPQNRTDRTWPTYGDAVLNKLSSWVSDFSFNDACVGGCQIGRSLAVNVNRLQNATNDYSNATVLQGTEDYLAAITDDIMINLLLTRMFGNDSDPTKGVSTTVAVPALTFGDRKFIIIVVVLNALISGVYVFELIRTRGWQGMPPLDFSNISDLMICASKGGMMSARSGRHSAAHSRSWKRSTWTYSNKQPFTDRIRMCLRYNGSPYDLPGLVPLLEDGHGSPELMKEDNKWASSTVSEVNREGRRA